MRELRSFFKTAWGWISEDTPALFVALYGWLLGVTWLQFGLRVTFVCFSIFIIRSLWTRMSDAGDKNPLVTIGMLAVLMIALLAGLGAYYAGLWREIAPRWMP